MKRMRRRDGGFTMAEILVVISVIVVLIAILLVALQGVFGTSKMASSMANMRQIGIWMQSYVSDNRERITPAYFDFNQPAMGGIGGAADADRLARIKIRSGNPPIGEALEGTWSDVLWAEYAGEAIPRLDPNIFPNDYDYRWDSPDRLVYENVPGFKSAFRSPAFNTKAVDGASLDDEPTPFGPGAFEIGEPGYYAANMAFDSSGEYHQGYYSMAQIRAPSRVMYLVDSFAGETIGGADTGSSGNLFERHFDVAGGTAQVDFRYSGDLALMMFLDWRAEPINAWDDLEDLQENRNVKVTDITKN